MAVSPAFRSQGAGVLPEKSALTWPPGTAYTIVSRTVIAKRNNAGHCNRFQSNSELVLRAPSSLATSFTRHNLAKGMSSRCSFHIRAVGTVHPSVDQPYLYIVHLSIYNFNAFSHSSESACIRLPLTKLKMKREHSAYLTIFITRVVSQLRCFLAGYDANLRPA